MINTKVLKLSTKRLSGTIKISDILRVYPTLKHFEPISESHKEERKRMIEDLQEKIRQLNITEEIREKDDLELTQEEQEKLYEEYVYTSLIDASKSAIKYGRI